MLRSGSKKAAILTLLLDAFKGWLPVAMVLQPGMGSAGIFTAELAANLFGAVSAVLLVRHVFVRKQPAWVSR